MLRCQTDASHIYDQLIDLRGEENGEKKRWISNTCLAGNNRKMGDLRSVQVLSHTYFDTSHSRFCFYHPNVSTIHQNLKQSEQSHDATRSMKKDAFIVEYRRTTADDR